MKKKNNMIEKIIEKFFLICAMLSVLSVIAIVLFVFAKGLKPFFGPNAYAVTRFLFGREWIPQKDLYGIFYMILGSIYATIGAMVVAVPIGILTAVFIVEFAPDWLAKLLQALTEVLSGIPSVIYGAVGLGVIVPGIQHIFLRPQGESLLAVIFVLAIMVLPTLVQLTQTAFRAIPKAYKEASFGLGASKMQTIFKVMIPAAKSGILSAMVLAMGRAIGETMAVMMIAGNPIGGVPVSLFDKIRPLTSNISMEMGYASGRHQEMLFSTGVVLFLFIMIVNFVLIRLTSKVGEKK